MSQSDYIKYKKISVELKKQSSFAPVLDSQLYTTSKEYSLENSIANTKLTYHDIPSSGNKVIMGMMKTTSSCPGFQICKDTDQRPNRVALLGVYSEVRPMRPILRKITDIPACECSNDKYLPKTNYPYKKDTHAPINV